jgi:hypothetical protein
MQNICIRLPALSAACAAAAATALPFSARHQNTLCAAYATTLLLRVHYVIHALLQHLQVCC